MRRIAFLLALVLFLSLIPAAFAEGLLYPAPKQLTITFTGDCTLGIDDRERGKATSFDSFIAQYGYEYPFANVKHIFEQDDLTVINLEGTLYDYDTNRAKKTYAFRGPTDYVKMLTMAGIDACSVGNNHIMDYGMPGFQSTVAALEGADIAWFGTDDAFNEPYIFEKDGIKIGFVSMYESGWWNKSGFLSAAIQKLKAAHCSVIIGCLHAGIEYDVRFDRNGGQDKLCQRMLAEGCDLVVGNHPHTVQGIWRDGLRTVLWSLGNFCFGGNSEIRANAMKEATNLTYIAQFTLSFDEENHYLGHQLNIIPCGVASGKDAGGKLRNYYQPYLATGKEAETVINAIKRDRTPGNLQINPYIEGVGAIQEFVPSSYRGR